MEAEGGKVDELIAAVTRVAVANEELIALAKEERDVNDNLLGPPVCPFCGTFNPEVRSEGGSGPMAEFVLVAHCQCGRQFFALPQGWLVFDKPETASAAMTTRGGQ